MTRLGYQIPNFTYPDTGPGGLFAAVAAQAEAADRSGFDTVLVMDHFYQLPMLGPADAYMLECYTLLAALAQRTSTVRVSALVTGNTYRNPPLLAKIVTTLDVVSGGRAQLGIGAGWYELEHDAFGWDFGTFTDRFEKLEEALQIIIPMLRGETATVHGDHYRVTGAMNFPPPVGRIPVMIGGGGERKTMRMAAQYCDAVNIVCDQPDLPRKTGALDEHCRRLGRDRDELTVSYQTRALVAPTAEEAESDLVAYLTMRGMDWSSMTAEERAGYRDLFIMGDPDTVAERYQALLDQHAIDGFTVNAVANGHVPGRVELLGETLSKVVPL